MNRSEAMTTDHGRSAAMPALASAAGRPLHPSGAGRRSRGGFAWFRSLFGLPAGAGRALRTALPGLLALLVAAGWSTEASAQTVTPSYVCQGQTVDVVVTDSRYPAMGNSVNIFAAGGGGAITAGTNFKILNADDTEVSDYTYITPPTTQSPITMRLPSVCTRERTATRRAMKQSYCTGTAILRPSLSPSP